MDELKQTLKKTEKTIDLMNRGAVVYPIHQDMVALKKRFDSGDPNVVVYKNGRGEVDFYQLQFTSQQEQELTRAYLEALGKETYFNTNECAIFISILQSWGNSIPDFLAIDHPSHKTRQRAIDSFVVGIEKMDAALAELDSSALGWLYANVVDKLAAEGVQVSSDDGEMDSMRNHPIQAQVEAGELRTELRRLARFVTSAATEARETLPKYEHVENDPRMTTARALERHIIENGIEFSIAESGFPAQCLRAVFELGGLEVEKVSYWLKKVADEPGSYAKFQQQMQKKIRGENLPGL